MWGVGFVPDGTDVQVHALLALVSCGPPRGRPAGW